jgi:hypothetical protein
MRTKSARELAHALDRVLAALAHDIGRAELARERNAVGVPAKDQDAFRAEPTRGETPEADGTVATIALTRANLRGRARDPVPDIDV